MDEIRLPKALTEAIVPDLAIGLLAVARAALALVGRASRSATDGAVTTVLAV